MNDVMIIEKKLLMDLLSTVSQMSVLYATGVAPGTTSDGILVSIERQLDRGALYKHHIDDDVRAHILTIVNNLRIDSLLESYIGNLLITARNLKTTDDKARALELCTWCKETLDVIKNGFDCVEKVINEE